MTARRIFATAAVLAAAIGGTAAVAQYNNSTRQQIRRVDQWTGDLVPAFASQFRDGRYRAGTRGRGADEVRAMMAIGSFSGMVHAFNQTWDRSPDVPISLALGDLDRSFNSADQWVRRARTNRDVWQRWTTIRSAYLSFKDEMARTPSYDDTRGVDEPILTGPKQKYVSPDDYRSHDYSDYQDRGQPRIDIQQGR